MILMFYQNTLDIVLHMLTPVGEHGELNRSLVSGWRYRGYRCITGRGNTQVGIPGTGIIPTQMGQSKGAHLNASICKGNKRINFQHLMALQN